MSPAKGLPLLDMKIRSQMDFMPGLVTSRTIISLVLIRAETTNMSNFSLWLPLFYIALLITVAILYCVVMKEAHCSIRTERR